MERGLLGHLGIWIEIGFGRWERAGSCKWREYHTQDHWSMREYDTLEVCAKKRLIEVYKGALQISLGKDFWHRCMGPFCHLNHYSILSSSWHILSSSHLFPHDQGEKTALSPFWWCLGVMFVSFSSTISINIIQRWLMNTELDVRGPQSVFFQFSQQLCDLSQVI